VGDANTSLEVREGQTHQKLSRPEAASSGTLEVTFLGGRDLDDKLARLGDPYPADFTAGPQKNRAERSRNFRDGDNITKVPRVRGGCHSSANNSAQSTPQKCHGEAFLYNPGPKSKRGAKQSSLGRGACSGFSSKERTPVLSGGG